MKLSALRTPRHRCLGCGACCQNTVVRFVDAEERERIRGYAEELGVTEGIGDQRIEGGPGCVFLGDDQLCGIHARWGAEAKPLSCQTFPMVVIDTESGLRVGIDPATRAFRTTWKDGDDLEPQLGRVPRVHLEAPQARYERALVGLLVEPECSLGQLVGTLLGLRDHTGPALPAGFVDRVVAQLKGADFQGLLASGYVGSSHREALEPLADWLAGVEAGGLEDPSLGAEDEAYALAALQSMLYLRQYGSTYPSVHTAALFGTIGVVALGLPGLQPAAFSDGLTAWLRLMRAPSFWQPIVPTPEALKALLGL